MEIRTTNHILIADPDPEHRSALAEALGTNGQRVSVAADGPGAMAQLANNVFQVVITELELPGGDGMEVVQYVQEHYPTTPVIIITAEGSVNQAVDAMRSGAFDFQQKPINPDHMQLTVTRALEKSSLHHAYYYLRHEQPYLYRLETITADSPLMKQVLKQVARLAPTNLTVLITGETGTGKSLVAGAIHANSPRREGTLVTVNCAALSETLLESELFGHEKGAFTGAHRAREGRFQQAHGGTLLMDEIGEMAHPIQAKILRAIEEQKIYRLGGSREIHVNVRILAATNRDMSQAVERGDFRRDLFFRLNVATLHIPPLRERIEDIIPLAERFISRICSELNRPTMRLMESACQALREYHWPGNVRELRNVVERTALFTDHENLQADDLSLSPEGQGQLPVPISSPFARSRALDENNPFFVAETLELEELERQALEEALRRAEFVQKEAATMLGISESRMTYKLNKMGITNPRFRNRRRRG